MKTQIDRLVGDLARARAQLERQIKAAGAAEEHHRAEVERVQLELESGQAPDVSSAVLLASQMVHSGDVEAIAQELVRQTERYELLRGSYAQALSKLQEERGGIMVCCRLRPCTEAEASAGHSECVDVMSDRELAVFDRRGGMWRDYGFDRVWRPEATQREVFSDIEPLVLSMVQGINCCLFAYGPTGSGKTHTIVGDPAAGAQGISYRTLRKLFEVLRFEEARHLQADTRARLRSRRRDAIASGDAGAGATGRGAGGRRVLVGDGVRLRERHQPLRGAARQHDHTAVRPAARAAVRRERHPVGQPELLGGAGGLPDEGAGARP